MSTSFGVHLCMKSRSLTLPGLFAVWDNLDKLGCPTKVIGVDPTLPYSFLSTFDLSDFASLDYDFLPDATHLLQLEMPEQCAEMVREFLETHGCMN